MKFLLPLMLLAACGPTRARVQVEDEKVTLKSGFFNDSEDLILISLADSDSWCDVYTGRQGREGDSLWSLTLEAQPIATGSTMGDYEAAGGDYAVLQPGYYNGEISFWEAGETLYWDLKNGTLTIDEHETGKSLTGSAEASAWRDTNDDGEQEDVGEVSARFELEFCGL